MNLCVDGVDPHACRAARRSTTTCDTSGSNILLIPGTSWVAHLRDNVAGAALELPADATAELDAISR